MNEYKIVFFDNEEEYVIKLSQYVQKRADTNFRFIYFSEIEELNLYLGNNDDIDVFILDERDICEIRKNVNSHYDIKKIICFSHDKYVTEINGWSCIYKYQSADKVLSIIQNVCCDLKNSHIINYTREKNGKIIGIYSPLGRCFKTEIAVELAGLLNDAILLSFDEYSDLLLKLDTEALFDMSDLIYFMLDRPEKFFDKLSAVTVNVRENLNIIPPINNVIDLQELNMSIVMDLLMKLKVESKYKNIVVDIGCLFGMYSDILDICDFLVVPTRMDKHTINKINLFKKNIGMTNISNEKIKYLDEIAGEDEIRSVVVKLKKEIEENY